MVQHRGEPPLVPRPQHVERLLDARERADRDGLDLVGGDEPLGEERDDGEREAERNQHRHRERGGERGEELADHALQQA